MIPLQLTSFIANSGPTIYIAPLDIFSIKHIAITNAIFYGWICSLILIVFLIMIARKLTIKPKAGLVQIVEYSVTFISNLVESSFNDKSRGHKYIPFFVTLFFFILLNNWLGLIPGVGSAITFHHYPLLRPFTADFNATLAAGLVTMTYVYGASIREVGLRAYIGHFFIGSPLNPLYLIIGLVEFLTDLTRVLSLSIRLFLNITVGEIINAVFAYLGHVAAPLTTTPFVMLELFVGALQAYIFVILSVSYLANNVNNITGQQNLTKKSIPETMKLQSETM